LSNQWQYIDVDFPRVHVDVACRYTDVITYMLTHV
jgi:hypothetical protein